MTQIKLVPAHVGDLSSPREWLVLGVQDAPTEAFCTALKDVLRRVTQPARCEQWGAFWAIERFEGQARAVGLCSYKGEPNGRGEVEIAYYTFPHREGRGVATAMVRALMARASPHVRVLIAHTLPTENASCQVLRRCGYEWSGEVVDPEDGLVWRWQCPSPRSPRASASDRGGEG